MPPLPRPIADRAKEALSMLAHRGGAATLPKVLTSHDIIPLLGRDYVMELLRHQRLPGIQVVPAGVWRCDRDTFVEWLQELSYATPPTLEFACQPRYRTRSTPGVDAPARGGRSLSRYPRNDAGMGARSTLP